MAYLNEIASAFSYLKETLPSTNLMKPTKVLPYSVGKILQTYGHHGQEPVRKQFCI